MTIEEALAVFGLKELPQSNKLLADTVGKRSRIAEWNQTDVEAYQLLFDTLLKRKKRKPARMAIQRGANGKKAA